MATDVTRDPNTGDVTDVKLDEVIKPGDPRWGIHNPEIGPRDTLSVHEEDAPLNAEDQQVDVPQKDPVPSDELYRVAPDEQASQAAADDADSKKSSSKSSSEKS